MANGFDFGSLLAGLGPMLAMGGMPGAVPPVDPATLVGAVPPAPIVPPTTLPPPPPVMPEPTMLAGGMPPPSTGPMPGAPGGMMDQPAVPPVPGPMPTIPTNPGPGPMAGAPQGQNPLMSLNMKLADPVARDQLLTQLAGSGIAPPTMGGPMPGEPPQIPVGPNPLQSTVAGLNNPTAYPNTPIPPAGGAGGENPNLGKLLAGAQAMKGVTAGLGGQAQTAVRPPAGGGTPGSYGSTNMAKAPGYLPTDVGNGNKARKTLGALLGGR